VGGVSAYERLREALSAAGSTVVDNGHGQLRAQCPAHEDRKPSLSVRAVEGSVLLYCHAGCDVDQILDQLGWEPADLFDNRRHVDYHYPGGRVVRRLPDKQFPQRGNKSDRSLFHADRIGDAEDVLVVEGEKDVHAAEAVGAAAVCAAMGAGKAHLADWSALAGKRVTVVPDADEAGRKHAEQVATLLHQAGAASVQIARTAVGKDLADHIAAGKTIAELEAVVAPDPAEAAIEYKMAALRITREAQRRLDDEQRPPLVLPPVKNLAALLAEPDEPTPYRIDRLAPAGGRVMLSAQYKAGKSTLLHNLVRALVDDEAFLGQFAVATPARRLVLIDDELSENQIRRWLREQGIANTAAVVDVVALRGRVGSFDLTDDRTRAAWAQRFADLGADFLVLDCLRPILDALGLDENRDAGRFLVQFDALLAEAAVSDAVLVHHMGHANERARGDSRLQDWPDAIWRVIREDPDDPGSARYFSAYGRDVNVAEGRLAYDPETRRLSFADGSRSDARAEAALRDVVRLLAEAAEPMSKSAVEKAPSLAAEHTQAAIRDALWQSVRSGLVAVAQGPRNAKLHSIAYPCAACGLPVAGRTERHQSCPTPEAVEEWLL
jgi:5S rRNA maturation endonuclease (ribonuclease M5)